MNDTATAADKALSFIKDAIAAKKTVYISTMTRCTKVTPKTVAAFAKAGADLFKMGSDGSLLMAEGKRFSRIATASMVLVSIQAA